MEHPYNRDLYRATEKALWEHPTTKARLKTREEYLEAMATCRDQDFMDMGRSNVRPKATAVQERVLDKKEDDPKYKLLSVKVQAIERAYDDLPQILREFVRLFFWERLPMVEVMGEMHISRRTFMRQKARTIRRVSPFIRDTMG